ncbi:unnamed protein product [Gadus morhua 'NCC']
MGAVTRIYGALCGSPCDVTLCLKSLAAGRVVIGVGSQLSGAFRPLSLKLLGGRQAVSTGIRALGVSVSMQLMVVLAALMGVLFSVRAAVLLPVEDRSNFHSSRELSKERKELILKLVSGLLEGSPDSNMLPGELSDSLLELEEPLESRLEERAVYNRLSLPQRDRKAPCKNFFWKTFTSC